MELVSPGDTLLSSPSSKRGLSGGELLPGNIPCYRMRRSCDGLWCWGSSSLHRNADCFMLENLLGTVTSSQGPLMGQTALWKQSAFKISCRIPWRRWEAPSLRALPKPSERQAPAGKFVQELPQLKAETRLHPSAPTPRCLSCGTDPTPTRGKGASSPFHTQHIPLLPALVLRRSLNAVCAWEPQSWALT